MISKRKATAMILGLTMGISGTAMAAPNDDADINARIAALEAQQQKLSKQLNALKKENAKLKRTSKVAESNKNAIKGLKEVQNRFQLHGFARASWDDDNIRGYIDRNDNRRTYLDLKGKFIVNDKWNVNFESETNHRYAKYLDADGNYKSHFGHDDEDGVIQRAWVEGRVGPVSLDVGRRWRGLGFQNVLFGNESDGLVLETAIPKSKLSAKAFHLSPTDKGYNFNITGAGVQGQVGHGLQIQAAFAKLNKGHNDSIGQDYYSPKVTLGSQWNKVEFKDKDGNATTNVKDIATVTYPESSTTYPTLNNRIGTQGFMLSAMWNPLKNIFLIGDYARTNAHDYVADNGDGYKYTKHDNIALRVNYRWSNIDNPGSFQLYGRWYDYAPNEKGLVGIFGDKEWGMLQPGSRGWIFGFKYVPIKNVEWETCYQFANAQDTRYGKRDGSYHRNFIRTQVDYHF
jgi:hypothetical protein